MENRKTRQIKTDTANRVFQLVLGILLVVLGCIMLAAPAVSTVILVNVAAIALIAVGVLQVFLHFIGPARLGALPVSLVTAGINILLGVLILVFDKAVVLFLPLLAAIWFAVFGVMRIVEGRQEKRMGKEMGIRHIGIGFVAVIAAVVLLILQWIPAMQALGFLLGAFAVLYGLVLAADGAATGKREPTDKEISDGENAAFYRFEEKLHKEDKQKK